MTILVTFRYVSHSATTTKRSGHVTVKYKTTYFWRRKQGNRMKIALTLARQENTVIWIR